MFTTFGRQTARWAPVAIALWLGLAGCADQWLEAPEEAPLPIGCPQGTLLDTRNGSCVAAGCTSDDSCDPGYRCDLLTGRCVFLPPDTIGPPDGTGCSGGAIRCDPLGQRQICAAGDWQPAPCPEGTACHEGSCLGCVPGRTRCGDQPEAAFERCSADGGGWVRVECDDEGATCEDGRCSLCEPGAERCTASGRQRCDAAGTSWPDAPCGDGSRCAQAPGGQAACVPMECEPGSTRCDEDDAGRQLVCVPDGSGYEALACMEGTRCLPGTGLCLDACGLAVAERQGAGCEYWFTHLPNAEALEPASRKLVLEVENPGEEIAWVRVSAAGLSEPLVDAEPVVPGELRALELPWAVIEGAGLAPNAFRLESTLPVVARTLARVSGTDRSRCIALGCTEAPCGQDDACAFGTASGGGTLLLPLHLLGEGQGQGSRYVAWSERHQREVDDRPALLAVVGTRNDTSISVTFGAPTEVRGAGGQTRYEAGQTGTFALDAWEVLQLATVAEGSAEESWIVGGVERRAYGQSFGGTRLQSDAPVALFSGADRRRAPLSATGDDHVAEQLPPASLWGRHYVGMKRADADTFTLLVGDRPARVLFSVPVELPDGGTMQTEYLPAHAALRFRSAADFELRANERVLLLQSTAIATDGGEPALLAAVPVERFRNGGIVQAPRTNQLQLHLVAPRLAPDGSVPTVLVAGEPVVDWSRLGATDLRIARVRPCADPGQPCSGEGRYPVVSDEPVGITVFEGGDELGIAYGAGMGDSPELYRPPIF